MTFVPSMLATGTNTGLVVHANSFVSSRLLCLSARNLNTLSVLQSQFNTNANNISASAQHKQQQQPWIVLLNNNALQQISALQLCCAQLRKLDLSHNNLTSLPPLAFWRQMSKLQILHLHNNRLDSIHCLTALAGCRSLLILTLYGNTVEHHPLYRHVCVNVCSALQLLDFYLVSDAEVIQNSERMAQSRFGTYSPALECVLPSPLHDDQAAQNESLQLQRLQHELRLVQRQHAHTSPVLIIQSLWRGALVRRTLRLYQASASCIQQAYRRHRAARQVRLVERARVLQHADGRIHLQPPPAVADASTSAAHSRAAALHWELNHTLYVVITSDVSASLLRQLIAKLEKEQELQCPSTALQLRSEMVLLSLPDILDDTPIVRLGHAQTRLKSDVQRRRASFSSSSNNNSPSLQQQQLGCTIVCSQASTLPRLRHAYSLLHHQRLNGCRMSRRVRLQLNHHIASMQHRDATTVTQSNTSMIHRLLQFRSPNAHFHEQLIKGIHKYNAGRDHYRAFEPSRELQQLALDLSSEEDSTLIDQRRRVYNMTYRKEVAAHNAERLIVYPAHALRTLAACVCIQSVWRAHRARLSHHLPAHLQPSLVTHLVRRKAIRLICSWWRRQIARVRLTALQCALMHAADCNAKQFFVRGEVLNSLLLQQQQQQSQDAPTDPRFAFQARHLWPEHCAMFAIAQLSGGGPTESPSADGDPPRLVCVTPPRGNDMMNLSRVRHTRRSLFPLWLLQRLTPTVDDNAQQQLALSPTSRQSLALPLPLISVTSSFDTVSADSMPDANSAYQLTQSMGQRLAALCLQGCTIEIIRDLNESTSGADAPVFDPSASQQQQQQQWRPNDFVKLTFASVEEARRRSVALLLHTFSPQAMRYLSTRHQSHQSQPRQQLQFMMPIFMLTSHHLSLCAGTAYSDFASPSQLEQQFLLHYYWRRALSHQASAASANIASLQPQPLASQLGSGTVYRNAIYATIAHVPQQQPQSPQQQQPANDKSRRNSIAAQQAADQASQAEQDDEDQRAMHQAIDRLSALVIQGQAHMASLPQSHLVTNAQQALLTRLTMQRQLAAARLVAYAQREQQRNQAQASHTLHRIRMTHIIEREAGERRLRMLDASRREEQTRAQRSELRRLAMHRVLYTKHALRRAAQMRQLDKEVAMKQQRRAIHAARQYTQRKLTEQQLREHERVVQIRDAAARQKFAHKRLVEQRAAQSSLASNCNQLVRNVSGRSTDQIKQQQSEMTQSLVAQRKAESYARRAHAETVLVSNAQQRAARALQAQLTLQQAVDARRREDAQALAGRHAQRQHIRTQKALLEQAEMQQQLDALDATQMQQQPWSRTQLLTQQLPLQSSMQQQQSTMQHQHQQMTVAFDRSSLLDQSIALLNDTVRRGNSATTHTPQYQAQLQLQQLQQQRPLSAATLARTRSMLAQAGKQQLWTRPASEASQQEQQRWSANDTNSIGRSSIDHTNVQKPVHSDQLTAQLTALQEAAAQARQQHEFALAMRSAQQEVKRY